MSNSVKLSNDSRDQIIKNAMHGAFEADFKAINKRLSELAMKCYRTVVLEEDEKKARKAPAEFLSLTNSVSLQFHDPETHRRVSTESNIEIPKSMPFRSNSSCGHVKVEDSALYAAYKQIDADRCTLHEKRGALRDSIKRTVYSTTSLKKLIEMWPEVEGFLPADMTAPKPQLPALPVADLNEALKAAGIKVGVIVKPKATGGLVAVAA